MDFEETIGPAREGKVKTLSEQLVSDPSSLVFASLADMYREEGMIEEALAMCQAGLTIHPRHIPGQLTLAKIHRDAHRTLEALEALVKVLALDPGNPEARALLESLDAIPEEPSPSVPSGGFSSGPASGLESEPKTTVQSIQSIGPGTGFEIVPEFRPPKPIAPQAGEEGLKIVPWGDATSDHGVPKSPSEGQTAKVSIPEIERSTLGFVPGAVVQDNWVISRPIEMDYPGKAPSLNPPSSQASERAPSVPPVTREEAPSHLFGEPVESAPQKELPVIAAQVPLQELLPTPSARLDEKPPAGLPTVPFEGSLFAAPPVAPRFEQEPVKPREQFSLTEFMKSLSEPESLKAPPALVAEKVPAEPGVLPGPSDELRGEMEPALEDLLTLDEVEGAMIVNRDGLVLIERTRAWINAEEAGALAASIYEAAVRSVGRMEMGQLDRGIVETALGQLYFITMGDALLVLLTRDDAKMGLVLMRIKKVMERVRRVLG
jgi:predicted regulator of Ras-like GTPase activity (Roadblock/LC7/MglB family)